MLSENAFTLGDYERSKTYSGEIITLAETIGDWVRADSTRIYLAMYHNAQFNDEVQQQLSRIIRRYEEQGEKRRVTWMMYNLAWNRLYNEQPQEALVLAEQVLPRFREMGDFDGICWSLIMIAMIEIARGHSDRAHTRIYEALAVLQGEYFPWGFSGAQYVLGDLALIQGDLAAAHDHFAEAVRVAYDVQSILQTLRHLGGFASLFLELGDLARAVTLATFLMGHPNCWIDTVNRARRVLAAVEPVMSAEAFTTAQEAGRVLSLEAAVALTVGAG
jgi:ATP/maltotriose-dependent transcriptional regulator MalT